MKCSRRLLSDSAPIVNAKISAGPWWGVAMAAVSLICSWHAFDLPIFKLLDDVPQF
jgi:hypothetical protein